MGEGPLGVDEKHVGHPDLLRQAAVEGHALVGVAPEGQTLVLPVVPQVEGHGEVLAQGEKVATLDSTSDHLEPGELFCPSLKGQII